MFDYKVDHCILPKYLLLPHNEVLFSGLENGYKLININNVQIIINQKMDVKK